MTLKKSTGNMYPWVTHTHCHLGGECPHKCTYCYVSSFPFGRPPKYSGPLRLIEKEFSVKYGTGKTIFIENCNDMFAAEVPDAFIQRILAHCSLWPENVYVFQTKNPARYVGNWTFPPHTIIGTTVETNRHIDGISKAPSPTDRALSMLYIVGTPKFVTIEPVLDFDVNLLAVLIKGVNPFFVNIGADSKRHNLPEPTPDKIHALIAKLAEYGIEIREKHNLERILNEVKP